MSTLTWSLLTAVLTAGCATVSKDTVYGGESFATSTPHSRGFPLPVATSCEAARRALLSSGYIVSRASVDGVIARKSFQPGPEAHAEIEFNIVCVFESAENSTLFVNAVQDRYALKKTSTSASLGVGPVGSVSLPFGSSDDSLVKVASETIPAADFYDRFFSLVEYYLAERDEASTGVAEPPVPGK